MLKYDYLDIACGDKIPQTAFKKKRDIYSQLKAYMERPSDIKISSKQQKSF